MGRALTTEELGKRVLILEERISFLSRLRDPARILEYLGSVVDWGVGEWLRAGMVIEIRRGTLAPPATVGEHARAATEWVPATVLHIGPVQLTCQLESGEFAVVGRNSPSWRRRDSGSPVEPAIVVTDSMVEAGARALAESDLACGDTEGVVRTIVDSRWSEYADEARTCLTAALRRPD